MTPGESAGTHDQSVEERNSILAARAAVSGAVELEAELRKEPS